MSLRPQTPTDDMSWPVIDDFDFVWDHALDEHVVSFAEPSMQQPNRDLMRSDQDSLTNDDSWGFNYNTSLGTPDPSPPPGQHLAPVTAETATANIEPWQQHQGRYSLLSTVGNFGDSLTKARAAFTDLTPSLSLVDPIQQTTRELRNTCTECRSGFTTSQELEDHAKGLGHRPYACYSPGCTRTFSRRDTFARHMTQHKSWSAHVCQECQKGFKRKDHLLQHMRNCHYGKLLQRSSHSRVSTGVLEHNEDPQTILRPSKVSDTVLTSLQPRVPGFAQSNGAEDGTLTDVLTELNVALEMMDSHHDSAAQTRIAHTLARSALGQAEILSHQMQEWLRTLGSRTAPLASASR